MLFSIIVPVYNASKYLKRCLDSILCQKFDDYEIVLIDDGSTDESPKICDEYSEKYAFVRSIHKENGGTVSARKRGVFESKGEYILSIDSDDYVDEDFLLTISDQLNKNCYPSILAWSFKSIDESNNTFSKCLNQTNILGKYCGEQIEQLKKTFLYNKELPNLNYGSLIYSCWTKAIKRELLLDAFMSFKYEFNYAEDLICIKRILDNTKCESVAIIDYYGYNYVANTGSLINSSYSIKKFGSYEETIKELMLVFDNIKVSIFSVRTIIGLLENMVNVSNSYKEFLSKVKETYRYENIWRYAKKAKIRKGFKDKIKILLVKFGFFRAIYKIYKH